MNDATFQQLLGMLSDPRFCRLRSRFSELMPSREEFEGFELPLGLSHDDAWTLLQYLRMQELVRAGEVDAFRLSFKESYLPAWFTWDKRLIDGSHQVCDLISSGSLLDARARRVPQSERLLSCMFSGVPTAIEAEGRPYDRGRAIGVLRGEVSAEGAYEEALARLRTFLTDGGATRLRLDAPDEVIELYLELFRPSKDMRGYIDREAVSHFSRQVSFSFRQKYCVNIFVSPAVEAACLASRSSFGVGSPLMGCLLGHLYFEGLDEPVLSSLPIVESFLSSMGLARRREWYLDAPAIESLRVIEGSVDKTLFDTTLVISIRDSLLATRSKLKLEQVRIDCLSELIRRDPRLNMRQIIVLTRALESEYLIVRLQDHQREFSVAYATARSDLQGLEKAGFLSCEKDGKAFWFRPVPGLAEAVHASWTRGRM